MAQSEQPVKTSPTLGTLQPSLTLSITAKAKSLAASGEDVISLSAGEPDFDTPDHIKEAAKEALDAGDTKYTPAAGRPELRQKIAAKLQEENGVQTNAEQIVVAPGAKFSVFTAVATLCAPGDEVIVPAPYWLSYPEMVRATGATCVSPATKAENNFCLTPQQFEQAITSRTKLLILNTPSNPTGGVYPREFLEGIAELAVKHNVMIVSDEIYEKLIYAGREHTSIASLGEEISARTITVNGFSKAYSMTGPMIM